MKSILTTLLLAGLALPAPAPAYKSPPPLDKRIEGGWIMDWAGETWTTYLSPQGFWGCSRGEEHWHGDWSLDGRALTLRARKLDQPESPLQTWVVTLDGGEQPRGGATGTIRGGATFVLRPESGPQR